MDDLGITFNPDGTIDLVADDALVHLRRPKVGEFRELVAQIDKADEAFSDLLKAAKEADDQPERLVDLATEIAMGDWSQAHQGKIATSVAQKNEVGSVARDVLEGLISNRVLNEHGDLYAEAWAAIIAILGDTVIAPRELPAWTLNPAPLSQLRDHWMNVPLLPGPTPGSRAASNGQDVTETTTTS